MTGRSAMFLAVLCAPLAVGIAHANPLDDMKNGIIRFDRDMCRKYPKSCKKHSAKRRAAAKPVKPVQKPEAVKTEAEPAPVIPREKPAQAVEAKTPAATPAEEIVIPREKPLVPVPETVQVPVEPVVVPKEKPVRQASVATPPPTPEIAPDNGDCVASLKALGVTFTAQASNVSDGSCTVVNPVMLDEMNAGTHTIRFPDKPLLNCKFALAFTRWVKEHGDPIVTADAKSPLAKLYTGPGYQCRGRNGDNSAKISEHGYGNAVDITDFTLADGRTFQVSDAPNSSSSAFATLRDMRASGCTVFTTVLGPGANAAHASHFHFDLGTHGKSGTYRICE
ncbi:extensin family protein [Aestuariivirga sp.]|uniref:extensin-like domain-containing protein n=1 Tax=Aestuariivirga sp. TaxID=2650926 RepID=UPI0039E59B4B